MFWFMLYICSLKNRTRYWDSCWYDWFYSTVITFVIYFVKFLFIILHTCIFILIFIFYIFISTSPLPVAVSGLLFARSVFNIDLNSRLAYVELHPFSTLHEIFQLLYKESEKMSLLLDQEELSIVRQQANK